MKNISSRTAAIFIIWIVLTSTIMHVVEKDLLGIYPGYELTSAVIMAFIGGAIILLPSIVRSDFHPIMVRNGTSVSWENPTDLKTAILSIAVFLVIAIGIHFSGIIPRFSLGSALHTLWLGSILFLILCFARRSNSGERTRTQPSTSSNTGSTIDS